MSDLNQVEIRYFDIKNLSHENEVLWLNALDRVQSPSVFHSLDWGKILYSEFHVNTKVIVALLDKDPVGMLCFYNTRNWKFFPECCSPLGKYESPYGGPLVRNGYEDVLAPMLNEVHFHEKATAILLTTIPSFDAQLLRNIGFSTKDNYTSIVDLRYSQEDLWGKLDKRTRNAIRKSKKEGVEIQLSDENGISLYYPMLDEVLGRFRKKPLPQSYYQKIVRDLGPVEMVRFTLAWHKNEAIAGLIALCYKNTVYYWSGASYAEKRSTSPNDFLQWDLICWAKERGYRYYDLLRVDPEKLPGIARFKMGFGGDTIALYSGGRWTAVGQVIRALQFITSPARIKRRILAARKSNDLGTSA
jgi:hypothetical protein